jgi:hypothetical protein
MDSTEIPVYGNRIQLIQCLQSAFWVRLRSPLFSRDGDCLRPRCNRATCIVPRMGESASAIDRASNRNWKRGLVFRPRLSNRRSTKRWKAGEQNMRLSVRRTTACCAAIKELLTRPDVGPSFKAIVLYRVLYSIRRTTSSGEDGFLSRRNWERLLTSLQQRLVKTGVRLVKLWTLPGGFFWRKDV